MKWLVFVGALVAVALAGQYLRDKPRGRFWLLVVLSIDLFNPAHINLISQENYRGDSRGIEITSVDLMAMVLALAQPSATKKVARYRFVRALYLLAMLLSLSDTPDVLKSLFSIWKLVRMYLFFETLATTLIDPNMISAAAYGLGAGVVVQGLLALEQKYLFHMVRVTGSMPHPNSLAMMVNLVAPVAFALWLSGRGRRIVVPVFGLAGLCTIISLSRGGMLMFAMATGLGAVISVARKPEMRRIKILVGLLFGAAAVLAKSIDTIIERFTTAPKESEQARVLFNAAAKMMANDHVFGVGVNMYSYVLDHGGYADRLHIEPGDRNGIAHHIYWLTTAELGYFGVTAYLLVLASVYVSALRAAVRPGLVGTLGTGITLGLTTMYLQGTAEWIARQTPMAYAFWLYAAMVAALRVQTRI